MLIFEPMSFKFNFNKLVAGFSFAVLAASSLTAPNAYAAGTLQVNGNFNIPNNFFVPVINDLGYCIDGDYQDFPSTVTDISNFNFGIDGLADGTYRFRLIDASLNVVGNPDLCLTDAYPTLATADFAINPDATTVINVTGTANPNDSIFNVDSSTSEVEATTQTPILTANLGFTQAPESGLLEDYNPICINEVLTYPNVDGNYSSADIASGPFTVSLPTFPEYQCIGAGLLNLEFVDGFNINATFFISTNDNYDVSGISLEVTNGQTPVEDEDETPVVTENPTDDEDSVVIGNPTENPTTTPTTPNPTAETGDTGNSPSTTTPNTTGGTTNVNLPLIRTGGSDV